MRNYTRPYVGLKDGRREVFRSITVPTEASHGHLYGAVIGPFRTVRAARFMAQHGANNPHVQTVADAERIATVLAAQNVLCANAITQSTGRLNTGSRGRSSATS